jgi:hypothetical protein
VYRVCFEVGAAPVGPGNNTGNIAARQPRTSALRKEDERKSDLSLMSGC